MFNNVTKGYLKYYTGSTYLSTVGSGSTVVNADAQFILMFIQQVYCGRSSNYRGIGYLSRNWVYTWCFSETLDTHTYATLSNNSITFSNGGISGYGYYGTIQYFEFLS